VSRRTAHIVVAVAALLAASSLAPAPAQGARVVLATSVGSPGADGGVRATIRRTAEGIPHIYARDWAGLGYGYGYALAGDNICVLADSYVTVRAQRSRYFGPTGSWTFGGNGTIQNNLNSDYFFQQIIDAQTIGRLLAQPPPNGPYQQLRDLARGYAAGYDRWLTDTGVQNISDPACRGKPWVTPITTMDAYRRIYALALLASGAVAIDGIGGAQPPLPSLPLLGSAAGAAAPAAAAGGPPAPTGLLEQLGSKLPLGGIGSNAVALGRAATVNHRGMLLGNPHFPWRGSERFYEAQLTIPGQLNVGGASLLGVPLILIGHTAHLAWSHTVSTAFRFTPYQLVLVPGSPTTYLVDGQPRQMTARTVTVQVRQADGSLAPRSRTLYSTIWGPMMTSLDDLPLFPWTPLVAYAMGDVNANNFRLLNHFFDTDRAQSVAALDGIERREQGIPWVNTLATDESGQAYYADIGAIPNVSDAKATQCNTAFGVVAQGLVGLPVLDGSRSACAWGSDPDAVAPGLLGPAHEPSLFRDDYTENSNDSFWLSNPHQPLVGYPRIIGSVGTARSLRTRLGLTMIEQRLAGRDGLPGTGFTLSQLQDMVFNDRQYAGELWHDQVVAMCRANPVVVTTAGPVDVRAACPVLAAWDLHDNLDSPGAVLFRQFSTHVLSLPGAPYVSIAGAPYSVAFSASDPLNTPAGLQTGNPLVIAALGSAVADLERSHIPLNATLRQYQYVVRNGSRIPIHGGPGTLGLFNAINDSFVPGVGYPDVPTGSSFVQAVSFNGSACPDTRTILTYSQSADPTSPYYADQTRLFSAKQWIDPGFCERAIVADRSLAVTLLNGGAGGTPPPCPARRGRGGRGRRGGGRRVHVRRAPVCMRLGPRRR